MNKFAVGIKRLNTLKTFYISASSWLQWISNRDIDLKSMPLMNEDANTHLETLLLENSAQIIKDMESILDDLNRF